MCSICESNSNQMTTCSNCGRYLCFDIQLDDDFQSQPSDNPELCRTCQKATSPESEQESEEKQDEKPPEQDPYELDLIPEEEPTDVPEEELQKRINSILSAGLHHLPPHERDQRLARYERLKKILTTENPEIE